MADLEKKLQDVEDKNKKSERLVQLKKEKILNLEKEVRVCFRQSQLKVNLHTLHLIEGRVIEKRNKRFQEF